jgi:hypothetical protein
MTANDNLWIPISRDPFDETVPFLLQTPTLGFYDSYGRSDKTISQLGRCDKTNSEKERGRSNTCHCSLEVFGTWTNSITHYLLPDKLYLLFMSETHVSIYGRINVKRPLWLCSSYVRPSSTTNSTVVHVFKLLNESDWTSANWSRIPENFIHINIFAYSWLHTENT